MNNKIIAVICVVLMLATVLAACGKKVIIKGKNGQEYVAATDADGSTILNDEGNIIIYVTDENGRYVKDANGERQTNAITFPDKILGERTIATPQYRLTMPEDWALNAEDIFIRNNNENITFEIGEVIPLSESRTLQAYLDSQISSMDYLKANLDEYKNMSYALDTTEITESKLPCTVIEMQLTDDNGTKTAEQMLYYIVWGDYLVQASYCCRDTGALGSFDAFAYLNENLEIKSLK